MFGMMDVSTVVELQEEKRSLEAALEEFLRIGESPELGGCYQYKHALLVFSLIPGDPESGAFHVYDRGSGCWYVVDFIDEKRGGYNRADFESLVHDCHFLDLVEKPRNLRTLSSTQWFLEPGSRPIRVHPVAS